MLCVVKEGSFKGPECLVFLVYDFLIIGHSRQKTAFCNGVESQTV